MKVNLNKFKFGLSFPIRFVTQLINIRPEIIDSLFFLISIVQQSKTNLIIFSLQTSDLIVCLIKNHMFLSHLIIDINIFCLFERSLSLLMIQFYEKLIGVCRSIIAFLTYG